MGFVGRYLVNKIRGAQCIHMTLLSHAKICSLAHNAGSIRQHAAFRKATGFGPLLGMCIFDIQEAPPGAL